MFSTGPHIPRVSFSHTTSHKHLMTEPKLCFVLSDKHQAWTPCQALLGAGDGPDSAPVLRLQDICWDDGHVNSNTVVPMASAVSSGSGRPRSPALEGHHLGRPGRFHPSEGLGKRKECPWHLLRASHTQQPGLFGQQQKLVCGWGTGYLVRSWQGMKMKGGVWAKFAFSARKYGVELCPMDDRRFLSTTHKVT